ncbi:hypothetical protein FHR84_002254 [Actinopolyspora biskrensis]|uniref:Uncharacterized protein n=1 Tax=Actinopolyspora biskrensis TaxID=1470178 RepID=A0A852YZH4_9ACTN|nr:hypothetical protein [Actinopolyspora biskrensis]
MLGSLLDDPLVVPHHRPVVVVVLLDHTGVAGLDTGDPESLVLGERLVELLLVVVDPAAGLVVREEPDIPLAPVLHHAFQVELRIRSAEVLLVGEVVALTGLPPLVPAFGQHVGDAVLGGEVHVAHDVVGGGTEVRPGGPAVPSLGDAPPHADVGGRLDPGGVPDGARLVEVEHQVRLDEITGAPPRGERAPGRGEGPG